MARFADALSPAFVNAAKKASSRKKDSASAAKKPASVKSRMYADGGGLYLHVNGRGAASWVFRYMRDGRAREMGLGSLLTVGLKEARARAATRRLELVDGIDPLQKR